MFLFRKKKEKAEQGVQRTREAWFGRLVRVFQGARLDESLWDTLEETLVSADVGVETSLYLVQKLKRQAEEEKLSQGDQVMDLLKQEMVALLATSTEGQAGNLVESLTAQKPLAIMVVGVNGSGKTTSIAKLAHYFQEQGKWVMLGAADTFRAAAIEQLQLWGQRAGVEVIAHKAAGDPGAVAFDALQAARSRGADVLIVDTAGRLHTKSNLMEELRKVRRVLERIDPSAPHLVLLVLDATTGHNGLAQARAFTDAVKCNGVFLAKLDGTAKGGIVLAIARELGLPVLFLGTGEGMEDMTPFDAREFVEALFAPVTSAK